MNSIERAAQEKLPTTGEGVIEPLELVDASAPILTPVAVAFGVGAVVGGAVWAAKNGAVEAGSDSVQLNGAGEALSAEELLGQRRTSLTG